MVVFLDLSNSITANVKEWYLQTISDNICAQLGKYDKLTIMPMDGASQTAAKAMLTINMEDKRKEWIAITGVNTNEPDRLRKEAAVKFIEENMDMLKAKMQSTAHERQYAANHTDLLGALHTMDNLYNDKYANHLIILSDMENYSNTLKMHQGDNTDRWLSAIAKEKFTNLNKCIIHIYTGEQINMDPIYYQNIKTFWSTYLKQQGVNTFNYFSAETNTLQANIN
ncbi:MAG: hypothetical protein IPN09_02085 [Bacteroidetes bacterium]|nr:hypothetical protein [Bacteroidota bacterium]